MRSLDWKVRVNVTLSNTGPMRTLFNPQRDADRLGIEVGYLPIGTADGIWLPGDRVIIISDRFQRAVDRTAALAHMLGHATAGETCIGKFHAAGVLPNRMLECCIRRRVSREAIPTQFLADALVATPDAGKIADALGVSLRMFADRVRNVTREERASLAPQLDRLDWGDFFENEETFHCMTGDMAEVRRKQRQTKAITLGVGLTMNAYVITRPFFDGFMPGV